MPFGGGAAGHLDDMGFGPPIYFSQRGAGIGADIITDDILYTILNIRPDDICYGGRTDRIDMGKLGMGQPSPLFFV